MGKIALLQFKIIFLKVMFFRKKEELKKQEIFPDYYIIQKIQQVGILVEIL
jgi:hypothetical protein